MNQRLPSPPKKPKRTGTNRGTRRSASLRKREKRRRNVTRPVGLRRAAARRLRAPFPQATCHHRSLVVAQRGRHHHRQGWLVLSRPHDHPAPPVHPPRQLLDLLVAWRSQAPCPWPVVPSVLTAQTCWRRARLPLINTAIPPRRHPYPTKSVASGHQASPPPFPTVHRALRPPPPAHLFCLAVVPAPSPRRLFAPHRHRPPTAAYHTTIPRHLTTACWTPPAISDAAMAAGARPGPGVSPKCPIISLFPKAPQWTPTTILSTRCACSAGM